MVAETAVTYSRRLAEEYRIVPPARLHNLLIQVGIKDRGLCYHWTEDLMKRLQALHLQTYQLHWGVAHKGSDLPGRHNMTSSPPTASRSKPACCWIPGATQGTLLGGGQHRPLPVAGAACK